MVLDQQFNKNSSVTLINTNVTRNGDFRDANVTGFLTNLVNKKNTVGVYTNAKMSTFNDVAFKENGYALEAGIGKISGKYRVSLDYNYADKN